MRSLHLALTISIAVAAGASTACTSTPADCADATLSRMTLLEKATLLNGRPASFTGFIPAIPRLGIPPLTMNDVRKEVPVLL